MIIVTGANGFIGSALIWEFNRRGFADIIAVDRVPLSERNELLKDLKWRDFNDPKSMMNLLTGAGAHSLASSVSAVYHMGAISTTTEKNWSALEEWNLDYTKMLFEWCQKFEVPFVYASSGSVYGSGDKGFSDIQRSNQYLALNLYGRSKLLFDQWVEQLGRGQAPWYGLRFFNVYGPNEYFKNEQSSVALKAYRQIKETGKLKLFRSKNPKFRDGEQKRDFVYVKDVVSWMWELLERGLDRKWPEPGIYNMGYGKASTWLDLAQACFQAMDRPMEISWIDMPSDLEDQYQYFTEADMRKWLGQGLSHPQWNLHDGVTDYIQNYLDQGNRVL